MTCKKPAIFRTTCGWVQDRKCSYR